MPAQPTTVSEYLASLPPERKKALQAVRKVMRANLDPKIKEGMQYGMIGYFVPHSVYPSGYHCDPEQPLPFAGLASRKSHMSLSMFCLYTDPAETKRFEAAWKKTGKRFDMGKACVRFKKLEDVPLEVLGATLKRIRVARFVKSYETSLGGARKAPARKKATRKKRASAG